MIEFIYKNLRHAEYRLQANEYKKMSHAILNNDINNKEKTVLSKLVGVKWCDIHKEWYIKAYTWLCLTRTGNYRIIEFDWFKSVLTAV